MRKIEIPNGYYCDARPDGQYVCLMKDFLSVLVNGKTIQCTSGTPLYIRVNQTDDLKFAGQNKDNDQALEWDVDFWRPYAQIAYGVSPCIYDNDNVLHIATPNDGSQGFRFVDLSNKIWTGDETYYSPILQLSEWSYLGSGYYVGQDPQNDNCLFYDDNKKLHHIIVEDSCRFIRGAREGNDISLAMIVTGNEPSLIIWATISELLQFPTKEQPIVPATDIIPLMR